MCGLLMEDAWPVSAATTALYNAQANANHNQSQLSIFPLHVCVRPGNYSATVT